MLRKLDQWTTALTAVLLVGALLACKKKETDTTAPTASVASPAPATPGSAALIAPVPEATAAAPTVGAKLGDVKRYADKEKAQTGAARVLEDGVKVYDEADDKTAEVATLNKGLLVFRLASIPDWELVEFPSGVGKVSPGWVLAKSVDTKTVATVQRDAVATQAKTAVVKAVNSAAPNASVSAVASAKPAPSASAPSAAAIASAKAAERVAAAASAKALADKAAADAAAALAKAQRAADKAAAKAKASSKP